MSAIIDAALPVFAIILAGFLCGRGRLLGEQSSEAINRFVYLVALPVMLFHVLATAEPAEVLNGPYILAYGGAQAALFAATWLTMRFAVKKPTPDASVFALGSIFGNTGYVGIPLAGVAFGEVGTQAAAVATVFQSAVFLPLTAVMIDASRTGGQARLIARTVATNPILLASLAGVAWSFTGLGLPGPVDTFGRLLGGAAGPSALFALGLVLSAIRLRSAGPLPWANVAVKLFVHPAVTVVAVFVLVPVHSDWAVVAILMAALPAGANLFVIARQSDTAVEMASAATLIGTVVSVFSVSALIAYLS
jgi:malonate transporter